MRILEIIPIPFFSPRGTGFSTFYRTRAMSELGHRVDVITLPMGAEISLTGVKMHRVSSIPCFRDIGMGPSLGKYAYNVLLFLKAIRMMLSQKYDCLHVHGESVYYGLVLKWLFGVRILHDMHGSLAMDYKNYRPNASYLLLKLFTVMERAAIRHSDSLIVICKELRSIVEGLIKDDQVTVIENFSVGSFSNCTETNINELKKLLDIRPDDRVVMYAGSFGTNQSLDLLLKTIPLVIKKSTGVKFFVIGGDPSDVEKYKSMAMKFGVSDVTHIEGRKSVDDIQLYMQVADVLVSPRFRGTNTPLKIYSYMASGKPIVATKTITHTQVLDESTAVLVGPTSNALGYGILQVLSGTTQARVLAERALTEVRAKYSYERFRENTMKALTVLSRE